MKDALGKFLVDWRAKAILPYAKGKLLDIGCGTNELVKRYGQGIGIDVYQWGNVDLVVQDASNLPYEDEAFETVTIIAALNHIPNREQVLSEARRILKKDGIIIITMIPPGFSRFWHLIRKPWDADQNERGMAEGEVFGLRQNEIRTLLKNTGFEVILEKPFMFYINKITIAKKT